MNYPLHGGVQWQATPESGPIHSVDRVTANVEGDTLTLTAWSGNNATAPVVRAIAHLEAVPPVAKAPRRKLRRRLAAYIEQWEKDPNTDPDFTRRDIINILRHLLGDE